MTNILTDGKMDLIWAAMEGHTATVKVLLNKGIDVNVENQYGFTAWTWAAYKGHTEIVELLKQAGATVHALLDKKITGNPFSQIENDVIKET